jgi:hypothetical protein
MKTYTVISAAVDAEVQRRGVKHWTWMTIDLGRGEVVSLVWFGTTMKMTKLLRQLKAQPQPELLFSSSNVTSSKVAAAIKRGLRGSKRGQRIARKK